MFGECHAHMFMDGINYQQAVKRHRGHIREEVLLDNFEAYLHRGVKFIRDGGDNLGVSKRAKELAPEYGIDYRTPIFAIHKKGHYGGIVGLGFETLVEYRALVERAIGEGCDFIKIMTTGLLDYDQNGEVTGEDLKEAEVREMVHIAHEEGMAVMVHVNGDSAVRIAAEAGVDSIEHGNGMNPGTLDILAQSQAVWVPTAVTLYNLLGNDRYDGQVIRRLWEHVAANIRRAYQLGIHVALGSDAGAYQVFHGKGIVDEYKAVREAVGSLATEERPLDVWLQDGEERIKKRFKRN